MQRNKAFDFSRNIIIIIISIIMLYPFIYCLSYSLSDRVEVLISPVILLPRGFTLENYFNVLLNEEIYSAFAISVLRVICGVFWTITITGLASYGITRKMPGVKAITLFLIVPMYITGGLLPTYVLYSNLNLFNTFLVYILPHGFWAFNMLLMRTYFATIPDSLEEAAKLDGASDFKIFYKIMLPLAMPVIAVVAMFSGVWQWNSWFDASLYITNPDLKPLQSLLQRLIMENYATSLQAASGRVTQSAVSPEGIKMATLIISTVPIVLVYPFLQKHFISGMMIGAVKS